jgi:RNA polymerase sigma-70 factor (ECF subfamily)
MLGDYQEACDVVQESFLSAYRAIGKFRGEARFSTWMTSIVINHSKNRLQQRSLIACRECSSIDEAMEKREGHAPREPVSADDPPDETLERSHVQSRVQDCINALEGEQKEVLVLREMQGFSYDEIGEMLRLPGGTVRSRLFRARLAMKDCLSDLLGGVS